MSISDRIFDAIANAIKVNDRVDTLFARAAGQAQKVEALAERVIRGEATIDILMSQTGRRGVPRPAGRLRLPRGRI
jgi:hypothetical protein